jgi:HD-GYP domain-containing protein (c-di-GMP phosphodiesterase class II)
LRVSIEYPLPDDGEATPTNGLNFGFEARALRETLITASHRPVEELSQQFDHADRRLAVLFEMAGQLNGLNDLPAILDRIVEATFDAFPAANFFTLMRLDEATGELMTQEPLVKRWRDASGGLKGAEGVQLSTSLLRRVVDTRESVLFVLDSVGANLSQSIIDAKISACLCAPLVGQRSLLGVMQVDTRGAGSLFSKKDLDLFSVLASLAAFALERARLSQSIVEMFEGIVMASVIAIEARDPTTAGHSERVATYTLELAEETNRVQVGPLADLMLTPGELVELRYAALLHDFGKIAVREDVLNKAKRLPEHALELIAQRFETVKALGWRHLVEATLHAGGVLDAAHLQKIQEEARALEFELDEGLRFLQDAAQRGWLDDQAVERIRVLGRRTWRDACGQERTLLTPWELENLCIRRGTLNELEWENMRSHAAASRVYLERIPWSSELSRIPCIAGGHHEKLDGSGYPDGLMASAILPQVRMLTIADIFDALTAADRPYRRAAPPERAISILKEEAAQGKLDLHLVELFADRVVPRIAHKLPAATAPNLGR